MRHQNNRLLKINTGAKTKAVYLRVLLSNFLAQGKMVTTQKRAKVLKAETDHFFSKLLEIMGRYQEQNDARREAIRHIKSLVYGEDTGKKVIDVLLPKYLKDGVKTGFVASYNLGHRVGDAAPKVLLRLV